MKEFSVDTPGDSYAARLYDPGTGHMLINGEDVRNFDGNDWYKAQGVLFQDFHLFALSIEENIGFSGIDAERIGAAAKAAQCHDLIGLLPDSYKTNCGKLFDERGIDFSGGESQRICLARAFYKDTDIWILDEPSASIDPIAEDSIFSFLCSHRGDGLPLAAVLFFPLSGPYLLLIGFSIPCLLGNFLLRTLLK